MPEAKLLTETSDKSDKQPFANNFFCISVGFCITVVAGLIYGIIFSANQKQGSRLQGFKCLVITFFMLITISSYLKPYLHMNSMGEIRIDGDQLAEKFRGVPMFTLDFGLVLGILAFSTVLSQMTSVPELLINEPSDKNPRSNKHKDYFKLPTFIGTIFAVLFKSTFGLVGAMMMTDDSNLFDGLIFSPSNQDSVLVMLTAFAGAVVLP